VNTESALFSCATTGADGAAGVVESTRAPAASMLVCGGLNALAASIVARPGPSPGPSSSVM
jgi:hypothetical protein